MSPYEEETESETEAVENESALWHAKVSTKVKNRMKQIESQSQKEAKCFVRSRTCRQASGCVKCRSTYPAFLELFAHFVAFHACLDLGCRGNDLWIFKVNVNSLLLLRFLDNIHSSLVLLLLSLTVRLLLIKSSNISLINSGFFHVQKHGHQHR